MYTFDDTTIALRPHTHISAIGSSLVRDVSFAKHYRYINSKSFTEAPDPVSYKSFTTSTFVTNDSVSAGFDEQSSLLYWEGVAIYHIQN